MNKKNINDFYSNLQPFLFEKKRNLPWREVINPYWIVVSELMLQQTQVSRIMHKFPEFISKFPSFEILSKSSLSSVLRAWQGIGYNRRAKYLKQIAHDIWHNHSGIVPSRIEDLIQMPGIGPATAGSIVAFVYNSPTIFIETNIRRVFIHHFFQQSKSVADSEIIPCILKTIDTKRPRDWYYAVMDYGSELKKVVVNPNRKSKHYQKQSPFEGSNRQVRSIIIKTLLSRKSMKKAEFLNTLTISDEIVTNVLGELENEEFIQCKNQTYSLQ